MTPAYVNPLAAREPEPARGEYQPFQADEAQGARRRELTRLCIAAVRRGDSGMAKHFRKLLRDHRKTCSCIDY